jgi:hypothetical protein
MTMYMAILSSPYPPKRPQEMKHLNTDMRIKYEEIVNGSPKFSVECEKNTDLSNPIIYYSV